MWGWNLTRESDSRSRSVRILGLLLTGLSRFSADLAYDWDVRFQPIFRPLYSFLKWAFLPPLKSHSYILQFRLISSPSAFHHTVRSSGFSIPSCVSCLKCFILSSFFISHPIAHPLPPQSLFSFHVINLYISPAARRQTWKPSDYFLHINLGCLTAKSVLTVK